MTETNDISGQVFATVWDALEDSPAEAANMRLRSELMIAIQEAVAGWGLTQVEAADRLKVTQPRLNDLLRGRAYKFRLDALVLLAERAGLSVRVQIERAAGRPAGHPELRSGPSEPGSACGLCLGLLVAPRLAARAPVFQLR